MNRSSVAEMESTGPSAAKSLETSEHILHNPTVELDKGSSVITVFHGIYTSSLLIQESRAKNILPNTNSTK